jgi:hypothetical protein
MQTVGSVVRVKGDTDRSRDLGDVALDGERRFEGLEDLRGGPTNVLRAARRREEDDEFVAPDARDRVDRTQDASQPGADLGEQGVARRVPVRIVDVLEAIQVDEKHREGPAFPFRGPDRLLQPVSQQEAVGQTRERVVQRLMLESGQVLAPLADVPEDGHPVHRPSSAGGHRHDFHLERVLRTIRTGRAHLALERLADREGAPGRRHGVAWRDVEEVERLAQSLRRGNSGELPESLVRERDPRTRRRGAAGQDHDALRGVVDGRFEEGQRLGHAPPLGHDGREGRRRQRRDTRERLHEQ